MSNLQIPEKLLPLFEIPKRFKVVYGGRGSGKSMTIADLLLMDSQINGTKIGCFREVQNSIEDSVHALLKEEIERLDLDGFTTEKATIYNDQGGEFRFRGLARNPDAVKSMHGFRKFWVEEAQTVSEDSLEKLTPTLREENAELWFSLNPQSSADPMAQRFIVPFQDELEKHGYYEDDMHLIIKVNYTDNPFFPDTLEQERQWDFKHKSRAKYNHVWLGAFNDEVEDSIILSEWFDACIDAHKKIGGWKPRGLRVVAHDPSDKGEDPKGLAMRHGTIITHADENTTYDVNEGCDWATDYASNNIADHFVYDAGGLGLSLRRQVNDSLGGKKCQIHAFNGASGVLNPKQSYQGKLENPDEERVRTNQQTFKNLRAQAYWNLRDRMYATYQAVEKNIWTDPDDMISLSSSIPFLDKLRSEVCRIPSKPNGAGLKQIMTKPEMRAKKIKSPNMADCLMMLWGFEAKKNADASPLSFKRAS